MHFLKFPIKRSRKKNGKIWNWKQQRVQGGTGIGKGLEWLRVEWKTIRTCNDNISPNPTTDIIQDYCRDIESVCRSSKKDGPKKWSIKRRCKKVNGSAVRTTYSIHLRDGWNIPELYLRRISQSTWCPPFLFTNILKQQRLCYTTNLKIMKNSRTCLELSSMETGYAAEKTRYCWHISGTGDYYMKQ